VFANGESFVRVRDIDGDASADPDKITCKVFSRYKLKRPPEADAEAGAAEAKEVFKVRDAITLELTETGPHSGIFVGSTVPALAKAVGDAYARDGVLQAMVGDEVVLEYVDESHIAGDEPRTLTVPAKLLVGAIRDVRIEHREVRSIELKAKKQIIEAKIYLKLAEIFKDVGLEESAFERAGEGLDRVEEVIRAGIKAGLDRSMVEEAFSIKWDLLLAQNKFSEAVEVCRALTKLFPNSPLVGKALLKIGVAKMNSGSRGELNEAIRVFTSVTRLKDSEHKAEAAFLIAEIYRKQAMQSDDPNLTRAVVAYKRVAENYPDSRFAGEALDQIIMYYIKIRDYRQAIERIERVFQDYPDADFLDKMLLRWAVAAYGRGDRRTALRKVDQLLREWPDSPLAQKAKRLQERIGTLE
jgi:outer membrane protein assembly factor BamD (BamD/ComL family)